MNGRSVGVGRMREGRKKDRGMELVGEMALGFERDAIGNNAHELV